ncbi:hypothetical protein G9A89_006957 [Geosiphon pyriformis]|nr:hypothetical protein G9A89_006957 [Geosiphon pyriformis]
MIIGTIGKDHSSYRKALFQYFQKDLEIPAETAYAENIKYYVAQQFPQVQQPVESDPEEYENKFNNPVTAQAKSTVNKKPRVLFPTTPLYHQTPQRKYGLLFGNLTPTASQTKGNPSTWEQPPAQNLAELASPLTEETAILQSIGSSDKKKQPALAPEEHSNTQTPIPLNITKDNTYSLIVDAEKAITTNSTAILSDWNCQFMFKLAFLQYFCDPNTLIRLQNQFSIIKQKNHEALSKGTTTPRCKFLINSLKNYTIALAHDFESAEQEANHTQAVNLVINGTSDIDAKITQLKKITTTADTHSNRTVSNSNNLGDPISTTVTTAKNLDTLPVTAEKDHGPKSRKPIPATQISAKHSTLIFYTSESTTPIHTTSPVHSTTTPELLLTTTNNTSNPSLSNFPLQPMQTNSRLSRPIPCASYLGFMEDQSFDKSTLVEEGDIERISQPSKQTKSNIPPVTITEDTTLAAIFPFDIDNLNIHSLFSEAAINQNKPIMALYTDARVGGIDIKLILDSGSASSIITKQLIDQLGRQVDCAATIQIITVDRNTKTLIGEIDNFPFEINGIQIPTKVLVMEAT